MVPEGFASEVKFDMPPSAPVKLPPLPQFDVNKVNLAKAKNVTYIKMSGTKLSINVAGRNNKTGSGNRGGKDIDLLNGKSIKMDLKQQNIDTKDLDKSISIPNTVQGYHVQVSHNKDFVKVIHDKEYDVFDKVDFSEILLPGSYWIRLSYIDLLGFEGKFNKPGIVTIKYSHR